MKIQSGQKYIVEMAIFNIYYVQSAATPKVELHFLCCACCLMVIYICEKFHYILNGFQFTEWTWVHGRNGYVQYSKGNNSKSTQTGVTVHLFCTSFHSDLHLSEILRKYFKCYQSYGADTNDEGADG